LIRAHDPRRAEVQLLLLFAHQGGDLTGRSPELTELTKRLWRRIDKVFEPFFGTAFLKDRK